MKEACAFFGHRELYADIANNLREAILQVIHLQNISSFWCGGYGDFDLLAARTVKQLKAEYPETELLWVRAYMPEPNEPANFLYDASFYPEGLETVPKRFAISHRNIWIADHCSTAIAYINCSYGGAYRACRRAARSGKPIIHLGTLKSI